MIFAIAVEVNTKYARESLMNEILCGNDLAVISEGMNNLKKAFEMGKKDACEQGAKG